MIGKAYQSKLTAVEAEIAKLRAKRPPVPYRRIACDLHERFGIKVGPAATFRFVKVRSRADGYTHCHRFDGCGTGLVACNKQSGVQASHRATGKDGPSEGSEDYQFICYSPLATGHRMNAAMPRGLCTSPFDTKGPKWVAAR
jgi:hypothetical protein